MRHCAAIGQPNNPTPSTDGSSAQVSPRSESRRLLKSCDCPRPRSCAQDPAVDGAWRTADSIPNAEGPDQRTLAADRRATTNRADRRIRIINSQTPWITQRERRLAVPGDLPITCC